MSSKSLPPPWELAAKQKLMKRSGGGAALHSPPKDHRKKNSNNNEIAEVNGVSTTSTSSCIDTCKPGFRATTRISLSTTIDEGEAYPFSPPPPEQEEEAKAVYMGGEAEDPWRAMDLPVLLGNNDIASTEAAVHHLSKRRQTIRPSSRRQLSLSQLLKGRLYCRAHPLVVQGSKPTGTTVFGPFAEDLVLSTYNNYVNAEGYMEVEGWLRFVEDSGVMKGTMFQAAEEKGGGLQAEHLFHTILFLHATDAHLSKDTATLAHFWILLNRIAKYLFPELLASSSSSSKGPSCSSSSPEVEAMDRLLRNVLLPMYMLHYGGENTDLPSSIITSAATHTARSSCSSTCGLTDPRMYLLLTDYAPNLWHLFKHYSTEPLGRPLPTYLTFPHDAQASEYNLSLAYLKRHQILPGREAKEEQIQHQFFLCISLAAFVRFVQDYGICPHILSKKECLAIFERVVDVREKEGDLWSPAYLKEVALVNANVVVGKSLQKGEEKLRQQVGGRKASSSSTAFVGGEGISSSSAATTSARRASYSSSSSTSHIPPPPSSPSKLLPSSTLRSTSSIPFSTPSPSSTSLPTFPPFLASFCEFQEMVVRLAQEGLSKPCYLPLFPTLFGRLSALLMDFGVADMEKLERLKIVRSIDR